ncbi:MAG: imidazoleglycerol-phosphate dehydratase HisB [Candidatus Omnitrophota bacterium]|nr:MAG: imidazoleglycerol-phosphate dehydratase HisB [Candidatus Omnitrophota bacterium]
MPKNRQAKINRKTKETQISVTVNVDGKGKNKISTGIDFLNHMLDLFAYHGLFDLEVSAKGDLNIDMHHTNEDLGICLGQAFKKALGNCKGIRRYGDAEIPMDQARAKVSVDISNRYAFSFKLASADATLGPFQAIKGYNIHDAEDLLNSFAKNLNINLHIEILQGRDTHHVLESVFKSLGKALDEATQIDPRRKEIPSTKGVL